MFEQSLVQTSPEMRRRKRMAALLSVVADVGAVGAALAIPLFTGHTLPPVEAPPPAITYHGHQDSVQVFHADPHPAQPTAGPVNTFSQPNFIPGGIDRRPDPPRPEYYPSGPHDGPTIIGAVPDDSAGEKNRLEVVLRPTIPVADVHPPVVVRKPSEVMESMLIHRVTPDYPPIARRIGQQGTVRIQAMISREGLIEQLEVLGGPPLLCRPAAEAVMQWRYRPYILNGQPVEVRTEITVNFVLSRQ